jgi:hypothetical protein
MPKITIPTFLGAGTLTNKSTMKTILSFLSVHYRNHS